MDEDIDDPENIFDDHVSVTNDDDVETAEADNADNNAAAEADASQATPVAKKRIVRNPRLKFDAERLCGERGIPVLLDHFKDVKFKGEGHEKEDLDKLLSTLEVWTHRLYPSMKFEDTLRQIEKLGKKRQVQVCLSRIRLDMPLLDSDFVGNDENDDVQGMESESLGDELNANDMDSNQIFDQLIEEHRHSLGKQDSSDAFQLPSTSDESNLVAESSHEESSPVIKELTEEQKERIEYNRMLAAERRKSKSTAVNSYIECENEADVAGPSTSKHIMEDVDMQDSNFVYENENHIKNIDNIVDSIESKTTENAKLVQNTMNDSITSKENTTVEEHVVEDVDMQDSNFVYENENQIKNINNDVDSTELKATANAELVQNTTNNSVTPKENITEENCALLTSDTEGGSEFIEHFDSDVHGIIEQDSCSLLKNSATEHYSVINNNNDVLLEECACTDVNMQDVDVRDKFVNAVKDLDNVDDSIHMESIVTGKSMQTFVDVNGSTPEKNIPNEEAHLSNNDAIEKNDNELSELRDSSKVDDSTFDSCSLLKNDSKELFS